MSFMKHLYKAYNLYKEGGISCEHICNDIKQIVASVPHDSNNQWTLVVAIRKINEYVGDSPLSKINHESNTVPPKSTDSTG